MCYSQWTVRFWTREPISPRIFSPLNIKFLKGFTSIHRRREHCVKVDYLPVVLYIRFETSQFFREDSTSIFGPQKDLAVRGSSVTGVLTLRLRGTPFNASRVYAYHVVNTRTSSGCTVTASTRSGGWSGRTINKLPGNRSLGYHK